jgi:EmrB/QacA subfamily drug resistance transporter
MSSTGRGSTDSATQAIADPESASALITPRRRNLIFVAVLLGMLLAALDQTIVATALPTVVSDLGGAGHQSWVVTSYLLASTIVTAVVGKLGDMFGRKVVFQASVLFFLAGSVLCGLAGSMTMLVAARALQGIGGGAIMVTAMAVIGEVIPLRERGRYQGALGAVFGVTTVIGPLLGGFFTDHLTWRWAFWINVPVALVVLAVSVTAIPAMARNTKPVIDYMGIVLVGLGASGLVLATSWGGGEYAWGSPMIISLFVGSAAALAMFVWMETRTTEPILPMRLFANPVFTVCCILAFIVGFAMLGALTFLPTFMQFVDGVSATESGLRTLPMVAGLLMTSMGSGTIVGRTGRYKMFPVVGTAVMAVGFLLLSRMDAATPTWQQSVFLFVLGTGIGMCMQVLVLTVQNTTSFADLGVATSGVTFFRTIGSAFGAAIFGSLFTNFLADRLGPALLASGAPARAAESPQALHELSPAMAAPIVDAYADSLGMVFLCAVPIAVIGFVVALFLKEVPLLEMDAASATDLGEAFGMPSTETPDQILEVAVGRMFRDSPEVRLRSLVGQPGCNLDIINLWALIQIYRQNQVFGTATMTEIGKRLRVPFELLAPTFDNLVHRGYVLRSAGGRERSDSGSVTGEDGKLWLTQAGVKEVDGASAAIAAKIVDKLACSPAFEARPDREQVEAALERIGHRMLVQRGWDDDRALVGVPG